MAHLENCVHSLSLSLSLSLNLSSLSVHVEFFVKWTNEVFGLSFRLHFSVLDFQLFCSSLKFNSSLPVLPDDQSAFSIFGHFQQ